MEFRSAVRSALSRSHCAQSFLARLENIGDLYLMGGVCRSWMLHRDLTELRDLVVVIDVHSPTLWENTIVQFPLRRNRFGGRKLLSTELPVDVWPLSQTWAFRSGAVVVPPEEQPQHLCETVFLSMDAIVYDWQRDIWEDQIFQSAWGNRILDIVLPQNPCPLLNVVRGLVLAEQYRLTISDAFRAFVVELSGQYESRTSFYDALLAEERHHYRSLLLPLERLQAVVEGLLSGKSRSGSSSTSG